MFILSSISRNLEVWSVNYTSRYENSELKFLKNMKYLGNKYKQDSWIFLIIVVDNITMD